ncbi:hypothetical protein GUITHDRAFT_135563 [Guillardia theta CCMP2712]|uniref:MATH domain-containing protein n=1 Tax=Guillardia theta (strain CCMP2712) TaxID=905079 RepID=L1JNM0_GUITC|nr:hypothetical protein GUITHDRAFT_135563 [Guillardia theta CCMP2712]EKX49864.1 hypothetical protein GUITHDRAFT_135563 [Guillardia theta CCMP2712]|eukprot:XP_005836844.1 hypothetical protein GUITHDRAFT_135563 [Guillardia theta CCMP2712]
MPGFSSTIISCTSEGEKTTFVWRVGRVNTVSFGQCVTSPIVRVGEKSNWKANYFPKGFTDPDYASLYVTNFDCENKGVDKQEPTKVTVSAFATVNVVIRPKPPPLGSAPAKENKPKPKPEVAEDDDDEDDAGSAKTEVSTVKPTSKKSNKSGKGSQAKSTSKRSGASGSKSGGGEGGGEAAADKPPSAEPIMQELSQMYTNIDHSWGWEKLLDMGQLYSWKSGLMLGFYKPEKDGSVPEEARTKVQDGYIDIEITILAVSNIRTNKPKKEGHLTPLGYERTIWVVYDLKRLSESIGPDKKLTSSEFKSDGEWYFTLYPSGYQKGADPAKVQKAGKFISLFLHSSKNQVELGYYMKQSFRLGIKKFNPGDTDVNHPDKIPFEPMFFPSPDLKINKKQFEWSSQCLALFTPKQRCFGKRFFLPLEIFEFGRDEFDNLPEGPAGAAGGAEGGEKDEDAPAEEIWKPTPELKAKEFVAGGWKTGGAVAFCLEMLVTDMVTGTVQHMLHLTPNKEIFPKAEHGPQSVEWIEQKVCKETNEEFSDVPYFGKPKVICYECGHAFTQEVTSYQARLEEYGYEIGREYILDILMREEEHWLDGLLKNLNVAEKVDNVVRSLTAQAARFKSQIKKKENEEGEGEEVVVDPKKEKEKERAMAKEREKEVNRQLAYEDKIRLLRKEIEDSHFGKPICLKCFSARQKLTHHETKVVFANEPAKIAKRKAHLGAMPIQNLKDPLHDLDQPLGRWECPDQNAITGFKGVHRIPPKNPEGKYLYKEHGGINSINARVPVGANCAWDVGMLKSNNVEMHDFFRWGGNFRYKWKEMQAILESKFQEMDGPKGMYNVKLLDDPCRLHAADPWIFNCLPKAVQKPKPGEKQSDESGRTAIRVRAALEASTGRNCMTLVRGGVWMEPKELTRQCHGRVNRDGITPEEDEDQPLDGFCDVRFDLKEKAPEQFHCLWNGKVYCNSCTSYRCMIPEFTDPPDKEVKEGYRVCFESKDYRGKRPAGRIQPVSKKPEEEEKPMKTPLPEEDEDDDKPNPMVELLRTIPLCGKKLSKSLDEFLDSLE